MCVFDSLRVGLKGKREVRCLALKQTQRLEKVVALSEYPLAIIPTGNQMVMPIQAPSRQF